MLIICNFRFYLILESALVVETGNPVKVENLINVAICVDWNKITAMFP